MKVLFVSTYSPDKCGLAIYTGNLVHALNEVNHEDFTAKCMPVRNYTQTPITPSGADMVNDIDLGTIRKNDLSSYRQAAHRINNSDIDIVHIQHEFGIFGGEKGSYILEFLEHLEKPSVLTCHTLLPHPSAIIKQVTLALTEMSSKVITNAPTGSQLLLHEYGINENKIFVVPHGVPEVSMWGFDKENSRSKLGLSSFSPVIVNFGLLSPNKGIEYAIMAMPYVVKEYPNALLLILGQTHPNILAKGRHYQNQLEELVESLHLTRNIHFINKFLDEETLIEYLLSADIYVVPYLHKDQISSGTLAYALGCGKAVISTPFIHATDVIGDSPNILEELVAVQKNPNLHSDRRGILVPFRSSEAIGYAMNLLANDKYLRTSIEHNAYNYAKTCTWKSVALSHLHIYKELLLENVYPKLN